MFYIVLHWSKKIFYLFLYKEKVYKELEEIYGTKTPISAPIKYDDLQHMHYLDRVLKETMRLFPAIPIIGRELTEDMKIGLFL